MIQSWSSDSARWDRKHCEPSTRSWSLPEVRLKPDTTIPPVTNLLLSWRLPSGGPGNGEPRHDPSIAPLQDKNKSLRRGSTIRKPYGRGDGHLLRFHLTARLFQIDHGGDGERCHRAVKARLEDDRRNRLECGAVAKARRRKK